MATAALITAGIAAAGAGYGAYQNKKAAEAAAGGGQVNPWGNTGAYMDELLADAWGQWQKGAFEFGPDPNVYNAYLDWGGKGLGVDTSSFERIDPNAGYGIEAYQRMLDLISGPAWRGATQTNPGALAGVQDPWVAGLLGGLGGYAGAGGFGGGAPAASGLQIAAIDPGYTPWNEYINYGYPANGFQLGQQTIQGAVPGPGSG